MFRFSQRDKIVVGLDCVPSQIIRLNGKMFFRKIKNGKEKGNKINTTTTFQYNYQIRFNRFNTLPTSDLFIVGGTWGFIDTIGNVIIPLTYEYVGDFEIESAPISQT